MGRLASRNVPAITIHLAGHAGLETTHRYLNLASAAPAAGIRALESAASPVVTMDALPVTASDSA